MVAMFANTYADVVKDAQGEAALRRTKLVAQLLRLAGGKRSRAARRYVASMGVENNCGIDRPTILDSTGAVNVESGSSRGGGSAGGGSFRSANSGRGGWAETVHENFQSLKSMQAKMNTELMAMKSEMIEAEKRKKKIGAQWGSAVNASGAGGMSGRALGLSSSASPGSGAGAAPAAPVGSS
jgi:hypothetical protein